jgi:hypothetical protein
MQVTVEKVSPTRAEKILNKNTCNRKLRSGVVERYAEDMRNEKWTECIDPIAFYEDGEVADGQHRLYALIESQTTQTFIIAKGVPRNAGLNIDVGLIRNLVDNARISGNNLDLSNRLLSVSRAVAVGSRGNNGKPLSNAQKLGYVDKYGESARWAIANGPTGRTFAHSLVLAAIARAWYYEDDKARLHNFGQVLGKGFMQEGDRDTAAIALRNALTIAAQTGFSHNDVWIDAFLKTQNAIKYFMRGRKLTIIKSVKEEAYPLPKDAKLKKAA